MLCSIDTSGSTPSPVVGGWNATIITSHAQKQNAEGTCCSKVIAGRILDGKREESVMGNCKSNSGSIETDMEKENDILAQGVPSETTLMKKRELKRVLKADSIKWKVRVAVLKSLSKYIDSADIWLTNFVDNICQEYRCTSTCTSPLPRAIENVVHPNFERLCLRYRLIS